MSFALEVLKSNYEAEEGSFIYYLHEDCEFNKNAFWDYYNCLVDLTNKTLFQERLDRELSLMVSETYVSIMRMLLCHFQPDDLYEVKDVPSNNLHLYIERLGIVYLGYFKGEVFEEDLHDSDLVNPRYNR